MSKLPETRYVKSGDVHIAYQVTGSGPLDLVLVPGWVSNLETRMDDLRAVGSERAVVCGYSDGGPMSALFAVNQASVRA